MGVRAKAVRFLLAASEYAFAVSAGITGARARFPLPAESDAVEGRGRLSVRNKLRFLHLEGSPEEMGWQQGRLLGPLIQPLFDEYMRVVCLVRAISRNELLRRAKIFEQYVPNEFILEMRAVAEGAGMAYGDILVGNTFLESVEALNCSCFAAYGNATRSEEMIFGRNLDFASAGVAHRCGIVAFFKPDRGIPFISIGWPGWCGAITAFNLEGLCIGPLNVPRLASSKPGLPYIFMFRRMAQETSSCDAAYELACKTQRTYSNNVLLAQTSPVRAAVVLEYTVDEVALRRAQPAEQYIASTNHFRKLGRAEELTSLNGRYGTMLRLLRKNSGGINLATPILSDRAVCLPNSLHTVIVSPGEKKFRLSMGNIPAAQGEYRSFSYDGNGIVLPPK